MIYGIASSEDVTPEQREWARQFIAKQEYFASLRHLPFQGKWNDMGEMLEEIAEHNHGGL